MSEPRGVVERDRVSSLGAPVSVTGVGEAVEDEGEKALLFGLRGAVWRRLERALRDARGMTSARVQERWCGGDVPTGTPATACRIETPSSSMMKPSSGSSAQSPRSLKRYSSWGAM